MDAILAVVFIVALIVVGTALYFAAWFGGIALLLRPEWVERRIVQRFWPERARTLEFKGYRLAGSLGLALALAATWVLATEFFAN